LLARRLAEVRKSGELPYLRPDGKSQVTVEYRDGRPFRLEAVVISSQHGPDVTNEQLRAEIEEKLQPAVLRRRLLRPSKINGQLEHIWLYKPLQ